MTWLISKALMAAYENSRCLQEQAGESLEDICLDGKPSAQLNVMHTQHPFLRNGKTMDTYGHSLFGLTCAVLTEDRGADVLTWYLEVSHARTSALQDQAQDSTEREADCGRNLRGSLARYDRDTHSLKTAQLSLLEDLIESSVTLPRSGTMRNGECFQQPILVRLTSESASGSWPTPTASAMPCEGTVRLCRQRWLDGDATLEEASAIAGRDVRKAQGKVPAMWPTPTASLGTKGGRVTPRKGREGGTLIEAVSARAFPTPTATMHKGWSPGHNRADSDDRIDYTIEREAAQSGQSGRLNPTWVEWLIAWPLGWTDLKPLETDKFLEWQRQHSPAFASAQDGDA